MNWAVVSKVGMARTKLARVANMMEIIAESFCNSNMAGEPHLVLDSIPCCMEIAFEKGLLVVLLRLSCFGNGLLGGSGDFVIRIIRGIARVTIWVVGVINLLTKYPWP